MKIFNVKKIMIIVWALLFALTFSAVGIAVSTIVQNVETKQRINNPAETSAWYGSGTESSPYEIYSIYDLETLNTNLLNGNSYYNTYFKLMSDLDYSGENFVPIGVKMDNNGYYAGFVNFGGVFDGNGHTVSNININMPVDDSFYLSPHDGIFDVGRVNLGFFAYVGYLRSDTGKTWESGVKNLRIKNMQTTCQKEGIFVNIGAICGMSGIFYESSSSSNFTTRIQNCMVDGFDVNASSCNYGSIGGLVGCQWVIEGNLSGFSINTQLYIKHCMVNNFNVSKHSNALCASISPAFSQAESLDVILTYSAGYISTTSLFAFNYNVSYCYSNSKDYTIIKQYSADDYNYRRLIADCNVNNTPTRNYSEIDYQYRDYYMKVEYVYSYSSFYGYDNNDMAYDYFYTAALYNETEDCWTSSNDSTYCAHDLYLKSFVTDIKIETNNSEYGSVKLNYDGSDYTSDEVEIFKIPKLTTLNDCDVNDNVLKTFQREEGDYNFILTATPTDSTTYAFKRWEVIDDEDCITYKAIFELVKITYSITFEDVIGTNKYVNGTLKSGTISYEIDQNTQVNITLSNRYTKVGYRECTFEFTVSGASSTTIIKYEIYDNLLYIGQYKIDSTSYSAGQSYKVESNTKFLIVTGEKTYTPNFG